MSCWDCGTDRLVNHHLVKTTHTSSPSPQIYEQTHPLYGLNLTASLFFLILLLAIFSKIYIFGSKRRSVKSLFKSKLNKLKLLEESGVVQIKSKIINSTLALPPGFIVKPIKFDLVNLVDLEITVEVVVLHTSPNEEVIYSKNSYQLDELEIFNTSSLESIILKTLAFILEQRLGTQQDLVWLNQRRTEIIDTISKAVLANLKLESTTACKQELVQIESTIAKLDRAQIELNNHIKESLATYAIAKLDSENTYDKITSIDERLDEFEIKRQEQQDFFDAYMSLKSSRN